MWFPALPHLPWYQLAVAPIPALAKRTLAALDRSTAVDPAIQARPRALGRGAVTPPNQTPP